MSDLDQEFHYKLAEHIVIDDSPNHRRIVIDGKPFEHYTNGPLEIIPQDHGVVVMVPLFAMSADVLK